MIWFQHLICAYMIQKEGAIFVAQDLINLLTLQSLVLLQH